MHTLICLLKKTILEFYNFFFLSRCAACEEIGLRPFCLLCQDALLHAPKSNPHTSFLGSLWLYGGPFAQAFTKAKFAGHALEFNSLLKWSLSHGLSDELKFQLRACQFDMVTWVPAHPFRRLSRGFHTSHSVARAFASHLQIPAKPLLKCSRNDAPFSLGTDRSTRQKKIRGRFHLRKKALPKRVLLVDDIKTTGATLNEAQKIIMDQGVEVWTFVLAQTPTS